MIYTHLRHQSKNNSKPCELVTPDTIEHKNRAWHNLNEQPRSQCSLSCFEKEPWLRLVTWTPKICVQTKIYLIYLMGGVVKYILAFIGYQFILAMGLRPAHELRYYWSLKYDFIKLTMCVLSSEYLLIHTAQNRLKIKRAVEFEILERSSQKIVLKEQ